MYLPRRKCKKVFLWIFLAVVAQVIFSLFLHVEFNFALIRHDSSTNTRLNRIKSRLRLQSSQDVEQMGEAFKSVAGEKLDVARANDGVSLNYKGSFMIKSTAFPVTRKNLRNPVQVNSRHNQSITLSAGMITQEGAEHKSVYHGQTRAKENNVGHEIRQENGKDMDVTELKDIFISVKTTGDYHSTRVTVLQHTWFQTARDQVRLLIIL